LDGNPAGFPAAYKILIAKTLCTLIAAGVMRCRVTGMIPGRRVFRTNYGKRGRGVAIAAGTGMPGSPAAPRRFETTLILPCSLPAAAALWRLCRDKGKAGGGRAAFREDGFYRARFNAAIGGTGKYPALFSRGMGEKRGRASATGTGGRQERRFFRVSSRPVPRSSVKCRALAETASLTGEKRCTVTLCRHGYCYCTVVPGG
jgi:hypothetical protein